MTFIIADTHFYHKNIIKYCDRPFENVEEMNQVIIDNWNRVVGKNDLVIHLGDLGLFPKKQDMFDIVSKLNGIKWLILGNHDKYSIRDYYDAGFSFVSDQTIIYKEFFILSHKPAFITDNMPYFNIYGHVHNSSMYQDRTENTWCVSVERINYTPVIFDIKDFDIKEESIEEAIKYRKEHHENFSVLLDSRKNINIFMGHEFGRIFITAYNSKDILCFREEFSTSKTNIDEIKLKLINIIRDEQHPITESLMKTGR